MEGSAKKTQHELNLAARKAEEAAWRRYQATEWLESLVGPLNISNQPTEKEFISCLRSGLVLCNAINKIQPGSVQKVVECHLPSELPTWDSQPLPAYQYFENVKNFLVAAQELKLTTFEAPVLERDNLEAGSSAKVVDCILELKALHEKKQMTGRNGCFKHPRSPFVLQSGGKSHSQVLEDTSSGPHRQLDMNAISNKKTPVENDSQKLEELIVANLAECMVDKKENIDANLLGSFRSGNPAAISLLCKSLSNCLEEQVQTVRSEVKPAQNDRSRKEFDSSVHRKTTSFVESSTFPRTRKFCRACINKDQCDHQNLFKMQENELSKLKLLLSSTKAEFEGFQSQLQTDMKQLESQVQEMSTAALGYHKVVKENMNLHKKVKELKGGLEKTLKIADISPEEMELKKELERLKRELSNRELNSSECNVLKENRTPSNKPRPRRLSTETPVVNRREKTQAKLKETESLLPSASTVITPPRMLSTENRYTPKVEKSPRVRRQSIGTSSLVKKEKKQETEHKETKNMFEKAEAIVERTPHRSRRLSIENCSTTKTGKKAYMEDKKVLKTPSVQTRTRRLSLEGQRYVNKEPFNSEKFGLPQAAKSAIKPNVVSSNGDSIVNFSCQMAPKSPSNSVYNSQVVRLEKERKIYSLQTPKTPESTVRARGELVQPLELQTFDMRATANVKSSHLKKSLRAIGKFMNNSEKRNQQNAMTLRRQSLAGTQSPIMSSTASLGVISNGHSTSRAITPPPIRAATKSPKRWL